MSITTLILTFNFTARHRWNPFLKSFILSHFERVGCVVQHGVSVHTKVRKWVLKYCKWTPNGHPRQERVNKVKELPYNSPPKQNASPTKDRLHLCLCPLHPPGGSGPASSSDKGCSYQNVQCVEPLLLPPSRQSVKRGRSTMNLAMVSRRTPI